MRRLVYIILVLGALALCSFYSGSDRDGCLVFSKGGNRVYVIDTLHSTYTYCDKVADDSMFIVAREICSGKISMTDSSLTILACDDVHVLLCTNYNPKYGDDATRLYVFKGDIYGFEGVELFGKDMTIKAVCTPYGISSRLAYDGCKTTYTPNWPFYELPFATSAVKVKFAGQETPLVDISNPAAESLPRQCGQVCVLTGEDAIKSNRCNFITVLFRHLMPDSPTTYYRAGDNYGLRGYAGVGPIYYDYIALVREHRPTLVYKDENYVPPFFDFP